MSTISLRPFNPANTFPPPPPQHWAARRDSLSLSHRSNIWLTIHFLFQQFPYPKYTENFFIQTVQGLLPLLMTLAFMYSAVMVIKVSFSIFMYFKGCYREVCDGNKTHVIIASSCYRSLYMRNRIVWRSQWRWWDWQTGFTGLLGLLRTCCSFSFPSL